LPASCVFAVLIVMGTLLTTQGGEGPSLAKAGQTYYMDRINDRFCKK
jgi:hypothetical protein